MAKLTIEGVPNFRPLSMRLLTDRGLVAARVPPLSSERPTVTLDVPSGDYVVIGTGSSGGDFSVVVQVRSEEVRVLVDPSTVALNQDSLDEGDGEAVSPYSMRRTNGATLAAIRRNTRQHALEASGFTDAPWEIPESSPQRFLLRHWVNERGRWHADRLPEYGDDPKIVSEGTQLSVRFDAQFASEDARPRAVGLVDEQGFGPIVIVPPFQDGSTVVFEADALSCQSAAHRAGNPSASKVPVGQVFPKGGLASDLLPLIEAPAVPDAELLWDGQGMGGGINRAVDAVWTERKDTATGLLAAHFLARFLPQHLPVRWLIDLAERSPDVADGPTLLAARYVEGTDREVGQGEVTELLQDALKRPVHLFAPSRALLLRLTRSFGPTRRSSVTDDPADFVGVAADAGGVECYWAFSPSSLHEEAPLSEKARSSVPQFDVEAGKFTPAKG